MDLPVQADFKHAKQGGKVLLCPVGYELNKVKEDTDRIHHFVCQMKKYGYKTRWLLPWLLQITCYNMLVRMTGIHNHDTDLTVKKVQWCIKEGAKNPTVSPRTVLANLTTDIMVSSSTSINLREEAPEGEEQAGDLCRDPQDLGQDASSSTASFSTPSLQPSLLGKSVSHS